MTWSQVWCNLIFHSMQRCFFDRVHLHQPLHGSSRVTPFLANTHTFAFPSRATLLTLQQKSEVVPWRIFIETYWSSPLQENGTRNKPIIIDQTAHLWSQWLFLASVLKCRHQKLGPFRSIKKNNPVVVQLKLPLHFNIHNVLNASPSNHTTMDDSKALSMSSTILVS